MKWISSWRVTCRGSTKIIWWINMYRGMGRILHGVPLLAARLFLKLMRMSPNTTAKIVVRGIVWCADASTMMEWPAESIGITRVWILRTDHLLTSRKGPDSSNVRNADFGWRGIKAVRRWNAAAINSSLTTAEECPAHTVDAQKPPQTSPPYSLNAIDLFPSFILHLPPFPLP